MSLLAFLPLFDWIALGVFFTAWIGYAWFTHHSGWRHDSLLATTNRIRHDWMRQVTYRDNRIVDGAVSQSLATSPNFFASTTILIIGGLLAALGASEKASELVQELPFTARTTALVFDLKIGLLAAIFVYAFFRFTWSMRQYSFGLLIVASAPPAEAFARGEASREAFADRAGQVVGLAAETFNDGLRAYYLSFAAVAWFFSPGAFVAATAAVLWVLYRREFHSSVLAALKDGRDGPV